MMLEQAVDAWTMHKLGHAVCVTTNPDINSQGEAIMGRGIALQAARKWPPLRFKLARRVREHGNRLYWFPEYRVFSFPVKHHWNQDADIELIKSSARELQHFIDEAKKQGGDLRLLVYLPRPGCGNGNLDWRDVAPEIAPLLSDDVVVVTFPGKE